MLLYTKPLMLAPLVSIYLPTYLFIYSSIHLQLYIQLFATTSSYLKTYNRMLCSSGSVGQKRLAVYVLKNVWLFN
jgi:hypothetical protein